MGYLIDSSVLISIERSGDTSLLPLTRLDDEPSFLAAISASELLHGVHRADSESRKAQRVRFSAAVFDLLPVLPFDLETARIHARLWADLKRAGRSIGPHDLLIGATALTHRLSLLTVNEREFQRIEGLRVVRWE